MPPEETKHSDPGILFKDIMLMSLNFERENHLSHHLDLKSDINSTASFSTDKKTLALTLTVKIVDKEENVSIDLKMTGIFIQESEGSISLEDYSKLNAIASMIPYVREVVSNITSRAGMPAIILPPMNVRKMVQQAENSSS